MKQQIILKTFGSSGFDVVLQRTRSFGLACCDLVFLPARPGLPYTQRLRGRHARRAPGGVEVLQLPAGGREGREDGAARQETLAPPASRSAVKTLERAAKRAPAWPPKKRARPDGNRMAAHR